MEGLFVRARLCWNCNNVSKCNKTFPHGRPIKKSECVDFVPLPPDSPRITEREIAEVLGCTKRHVRYIVSMQNGTMRLIKALADRGVHVTYECGEGKILFYREDIVQ